MKLDRYGEPISKHYWDGGGRKEIEEQVRNQLSREEFKFSVSSTGHVKSPVPGTDTEFAAVSVLVFPNRHSELPRNAEEPLERQNSVDLLWRALDAAQPWSRAPVDTQLDTIKAGLQVLRNRHPDDRALHTFLDNFEMITRMSAIGHPESLEVSCLLRLKEASKTSGLFGSDITEINSMMAHIQRLTRVVPTNAEIDELDRQLPKLLPGGAMDRLFTHLAVVQDAALVRRAEIELRLLVKRVKDSIEMQPEESRKDPLVICESIRSAILLWGNSIAERPGIVDALASHQLDCDMLTVTYLAVGAELGVPMEMRVALASEGEKSLGHAVVRGKSKAGFFLWETTSALEGATLGDSRPARYVYKNEAEFNRLFNSMMKNLGLSDGMKVKTVGLSLDQAVEEAIRATSKAP